MMLKDAMLAALRSARERWRSRAEAWHCADFDDRQRRELGLPRRHPRSCDLPRPDWF